MEITAAGMDADTVIPANKPRYALAPASTMDNKTPRTIALGVISGKDLDIFSPIISCKGRENILDSAMEENEYPGVHSR